MSRAGEQHEIGQSVGFSRPRCRRVRFRATTTNSPSSGNRGCPASTDAHGTLSVGRKVIVLLLPTLRHSKASAEG